MADISTETSDLLGLPRPAQFNYGNFSHNVSLDNLVMNANLAWLVGSLATSILWVVYITFYNSRVVGYFLTKIINRMFMKGCYFKIGSLNLNPLAGKIMFRDVVYICFDYSIRVQDGYFIFRWWRSYVPKDVSEDLSHSDTRLSVMLNGFELHVFNRSEMYSKLEKIFGLKPSILIPNENMTAEEAAKMREVALNLENERKNSVSTNKNKKAKSEAMAAKTWRDLIPVIKIDICSGRFVFGNRLTPTTLSLCVEEAKCVYSTKPAASRLDHFMHFLKAKIENAKVLLAPSPKYTGLVDDPPRYMGEGYVVMMSNLVELYYYIDEPGIVEEEPVLLTLANGDVVEASPPVWGLDVKCGKGTNFSYGPWADRQRDHLFKFFFPPDWQTMQVTTPPKPGDRREYQSFDLSLSTLNEATIDVLFSKNKETNAMHVTIGPGSYFELTLPWIILQDGFTTKVAGQLLHVEATTSLQYRSLAKCESLEFKIRVHYPLRFNDHQEWIINLTGCKATAYLLFAHKLFFQDLIEDWASKARPDILEFVPYTWKFCVLLKEFEILMLCNDYNWIDCSSTNQENNHLAFCGDLFDLSFNLPFDDFLPKTIPIRLWIHGEDLDLSLYLPEISTTRPVVLGMDANMKFLTRDGQVKRVSDIPKKKWRKDCLRSAGWIDCWSVSIVAIKINWIYHLIPPLGPVPQADITTPEKEEILLSPIRMPKLKSPALKWVQTDSAQFDPNTLPPDKVNVEIEIGSSVLFAYGTILRNFINLKENIFGEDQEFTDMSVSVVNTKSSVLPNLAQSILKVPLNSSNKDDASKSISEASAVDEKPKPFDPRLYRPLEVIVSFTIHDVQAHIVKSCNDNDPPCPIILIERLGLELKKRFYETEIQILVSPSFLISSDTVVRPSKEKHLKQGHLLLSALQVRGHAMFSMEGRSLDEETVEYGWLLEIHLGKLSGKLTIPQLYHIVTGLETFLTLAIDAENELRPPISQRDCHHGVSSSQCAHTKDEIKYRCPTSEDIKYRMTRVALDVIDLYLIDSGTALHTWISPVRVSTCNLHGQKVKSGVTALISTVLIRHFVSTNGHFSQANNGSSSYSNTNTTGSGRSSKVQQPHSQNNSDEKREDLNILVKKDAGSSVKYKKESDYGFIGSGHRRGSRDKDDVHSHRRSRDNDFHHRRERDEFSSMHSSGRDKIRDSETDPWLEVGCVSFGPVVLESASALPIPEHCLHLVQHNFLKVHDKKHKRLWFLWNSGFDAMRCGCIGGTAFFGNNINGPKFFKPSAQDIQDGINIARYHINTNSKEYGFGQSILYENQLVFHTPPYSLQPVSLQECYEYIGKTNICVSKYDPEPKSPHNVDTLCTSSISPIEKSDRQSNAARNVEGGSPNVFDRKQLRKHSTSTQRQNSSSSTHEVPYARLIDSPNRKPGQAENSSTPLPNESDVKFKTNRSIRMPTPKSSASESKLTVDYFQKSDISIPSEIMSHSAPQTHPLQFDSDQSIDSKIKSDESLAREVQRTISLTSENPSEAFFSADEDMHSSSLRTSITDRVIQKKRFASDLSIGVPPDVDGCLSTHRSDYEIHTPDNRDYRVNAKRPQSTAELAESQESSSDTPSLSSNSFISAMSSQEDITLVNLHMQVNKPIIDSPLLMASYVSHLAQVRCTNWSSCCLPLGADAFSTPLFQQNDDGGLTYIGCKLVPNFNTYSNWREIRIVSHSDAGSTSSMHGTQSIPRSHPWDPSVTIRSADTGSHVDNDEKEFMTSQNDTATRNSVVVKFKGNLEVTLTPLLLEGLQKMIESAIPVFSTMHPLNAINSMHASCIRNVEAANILKKDQSLSYWSRVHSNSKRSTAERNLQGPGGGSGPVITDVYEESISTQIQGLVVLQRVNISLIQTSVVEEVISFSALDNVQELSCASLLAVSFDQISARLHLGKTTKAAIHTVYTPTVRSSGLKKGRIMKGTRALLSHLSSHTRNDNIPGEPILIETSEKQQEELVITCDISKAHAQLRRLKNESVVLQDGQIIVTAIPIHKSRAMFDCIKLPEESNKDINAFGLIMFECGLEGIRTKMVKRSQFEKSENNEDNIKTVVDSTNKRDASNADKHTGKEEPSGTKGSETMMPKSNLKNPTTPKTPRDKLQSNSEIKSKEGETNVKDKIKFSFKSSESVHKAGGSDQSQQPSTSANAASHDKETNKAVVAVSNNNGRASSCVIDLKTVWFNFAAPPSVPITRKIDYTRLDWNLLSTASPAITAWMNPSNRFAIKVVAMMKAFHLRRTAIAACIMADGLEVQGIQKHPKTRYSAKFTPLAKTLQEDPSCQLCTVMQKFVIQETSHKINHILKHPDLPQLTTLRQGVIVLSRQWKNMLYNPMLFEHQYKNKLTRPLNVTFAVPQSEEEGEDENDMDGNEPAEHNTLINDEESEHTMLLGRGANQQYKVLKAPDVTTQVKLSDSANTSPSFNSMKMRKRPSKNSLPHVVHSSRSSLHMFPIISGLVEKQNLEIEYGTLRDGSLQSCYSSNTSLDRPWSPTPKDDLYSWMAKQHKERKESVNKENAGSIIETKRTMTPTRPSFGASVMQDSLRLLDAHLIFEPILTCLGVMPQQMVNNITNADMPSLDSLGTNLSLVGSFDVMRIDIVVSEPNEKKLKNRPGPRKTNGKFPHPNLEEMPAFLCERVGVELEVLKVTDGLTDDNKPNALYVSRGQLKKLTSTMINFSFNVRYISQQVNMPLLRLLHQITNMYQNVKDAQDELCDQPTTYRNTLPLKDESSLASEMNDPTIMESIQEPLDSTLQDEHYDKFNEGYQLGHSSSKGRIPTVALTPSPGVRRPQSFAQKLKSTSKTVKGKLGYTNLNESILTPIKKSPTMSIDNPFRTSKNFGDHQKFANGLPFGIAPDAHTHRSSSSNILPGTSGLMDTPICWKTMFHLLELYATMPETKTVKQRVSISPDPTEKTAKKLNISNESKTIDIEEEIPTTPLPPHRETTQPERTRLIVFGVAKIQKTRLLATLSGLKLEAEISALHSSATWRKKTRPIALECSHTGQLGRAMIVLLEGVAPNQQTVVKVTVGKSQTLYSSVSRRGKDKNNGLLSIGAVNIDIPQHPVALHGVMTRSSKQLSTTLQELRVTRNSARLSRQNEEAESPTHSKDNSKENGRNIEKTTPFPTKVKSASGLIQPLVMQFNILLQSLSISAALLPSLQAQYKMDRVTSNGISGYKAKFTIDLPNHTLSFTTKHSTTSSAETILPPEASISLPPIHVSAQYVTENASQDIPVDGVVLRQGGYVSASAEIGKFERCLTTDLLNHLVFAQKVFMREVNEVVQKVLTGEKPVPLWLDDGEVSTSPVKQILFSLNIRMERIQLTATTPCSSAVRFETNALEFHLSNRVKNIAERANTKLFVKAQIDFNLSLGQIIRNVMFDEADPEFQQYAFFNTTIDLRNAFQDEMLNDDQELVLITLKRPLIYIQPVAVDKAILVWLNYKNAYEYWAERRANLNKDVLTATQQVLEKMPFQHLSASNLSTLFLQLTVEDMGICLPLNQPPMTNWTARSFADFEPRGAVVITLENTNITACNSGSLVSTGKFFGLCLRFTDEFETTLDDWKPNMNEPIMNLCVVSEGTYEVCSRTTVAKNSTENAKWLLNVKWQMEGVDIHLDVNIGKQLSALGHTLTTLSSFEEDESTTIYSQDSDDGDGSVKTNKEKQNKRQQKTMENIPSFIFDPTLDSKKRSLMMKKEMSEQVKTINDLRTLGATAATIAAEERRLQELQALCYKYFRRDMIQKWKRPSKVMLRTANRSQSFVAASPSDENFLVQELADNDLNNMFDYDSGDLHSESSKSGPTRSSSLKIRSNQTQRVSFNDTMRQSSLPSGDSVTFDWKGSQLSDVIDVDGERVELRKKNLTYPQKQQEPNIDFELDIKVLVNSGKCVLHTKPVNDEKINVNTSATVKHHKRERSIGTDWGSPVAGRRNKDKTRLRYTTPQNTVFVDLTIFHIPGLDVKVHYESKTVSDEAMPRLSVTDTSTFRRSGFKRASLFAWMTLQSVPEETIISPHILEFLEQTLEPIPLKTEELFPSNNPVNMDLLQENYNYVAYASFPVDVIVYFHMQPSTFRFSCLPVSRVECLLQLPSLDIVFSSKRQDDDQVMNDADKTPTGGLSITGCLADFNVYIFHPYGGGKKSGQREPSQFSPLADSERKDSLSINVEFVKFHLTRARKINFETNFKKSSEQRAIVRFSTIVDIGSASFKYDMRRLTEILAFPNAWYRRRIVRRLFLGDISTKMKTNPTNEPEAPTSPNPSELNKDHASIEKPVRKPGDLRLDIKTDNISPTSKLHSEKSSFDSSTSLSESNQIASWETLVLFAFNFTKLNVQMNMGNVMGNVIWLTKAFRSDGRLSIGSTGRKNMYIGFGLGGSTLDAKGGIVGGTIDLNKINTYTHIWEEQGVEPHHKLGLTLAALELRLDYMGTSVLMTRISSLNVAMRDEWKCSTEIGKMLPNERPTIILIHGDLSWDQFQMMISKSTTADLLKMFYKLEEFFSQQFKSSKRVFTNLEPRLSSRSSSSISRRQRKTTLNSENSFESREWGDAHHHRHWQKPLKKAMGLMLTTLSVPLPKTGIVLGGTIELHGTNISLACFHGINFKAKSWALFSLRDPCINFATEAKQIDNTNDVIVIQTLTFGLGIANNTNQTHSLATVCRMTRNIIFPPQFKTLQEWFSYAFASSEIDAVERFPVSEREKEQNTNSIERSRGQSNKTQDHNHNREVIFALPSLRLHFKSEHLQGPCTPDSNSDKPSVQCSFITEFEDHIFVTVDADAFFFLHDLITSYVKEKEKMLISQNARASSPNPSHSSNSPTSPNDVKKSDQAPTTSSSPSPSTSTGESTPNQSKKGSTDKLQAMLNSKTICAKLNKSEIEAYLRDWRNFECQTWHLEPTVRLLSWAGKSIEPYGIDYILNKLGFSHARTTIPKWLQRGFMDPLDSLAALLIIQLLSLVKDDSTSSSDDAKKDNK